MFAMLPLKEPLPADLSLEWGLSSEDELESEVEKCLDVGARIREPGVVGLVDDVWPPGVLGVWAVVAVVVVV